MHKMTKDELPELIEFEGDWNKFIETVYQVFRNDFIENSLYFRNKKVNMKRHPLVDGKEYTFYHITHEGNTENERTPDLRRCERIRWARTTIENCDKWGLKAWLQKRNGKNRICIWLEIENEPDYIVILDIRVKFCLLWTAFTLQHEHEKRKKEKEYQSYLKAKAEKGEPDSTS